MSAPGGADGPLAPALHTRSRRDLVDSALRRPGLRRLAIVFGCFRASEVGSWIAIITLAHGFGGVDEASAIVVVQLAPSAVAALFVHRLAARVGPRTVLVGGLGVQVAGLASVALAIAVDAPHLVIYAPAVVLATAVVTTRPVLAAILPAVVEDPHELTAANALVGTLDGAATLAGPVLVGVGLAIGPAVPFVAFGALVALGLVVASRVAVGPSQAAADPARAPAPPAARAERGRTGGVRALLAVVAAQALLIGAVDLLFVVVAVDLTHGPPERTAWLSSAFGAGALLGGAASTWMVGRARLWPVVVLAGVAAGGALAAVSTVSTALPAAVALAGCGGASTVLLVAARSLLQRVCDLDALCRAFSFAEASEMAMLLLGALVVPALVGRLGAAWAPAGVALVVVGLLAVVAHPMAAAEGRVASPLAVLALLRQVDLFAHLPAPSLETLAREATPRHAGPGEVVITEGEHGDEFFVVASGGLTVTWLGAFVRRLQPGEGFGEVALLLDSPRTATVTADEDSALLVVDRTAFLVAMTGQAPEDTLRRRYGIGA